jgi:hypothetical protein
VSQDVKRFVSFESASRRRSPSAALSLSSDISSRGHRRSALMVLKCVTLISRRLPCTTHL